MIKRKLLNFGKELIKIIKNSIVVLTYTKQLLGLTKDALSLIISIIKEFYNG